MCTSFRDIRGYKHCSSVYHQVLPMYYIKEKSPGPGLNKWDLIQDCYNKDKNRTQFHWNKSHGRYWGSYLFYSFVFVFSLPLHCIHVEHTGCFSTHIHSDLFVLILTFWNYKIIVTSFSSSFSSFQPLPCTSPCSLKLMASLIFNHKYTLTFSDTHF